MTKVRSDLKKSNKHLDIETVSAVKALFQKGVPATIIASLYNIAVSTVYMIGYEERRANVEAMPKHRAIADINARFQRVVNNANGV
jgi:DNA invertase Pin-like site-specific DNA recombinase